MKKQLGFTLIELLVVMAIIGILATIGLASFRTAQIKGRDTQRKQDLDQIQKALEMFYNDKGRYLTSSEGLPTGGAEWRDPDEPTTLYIKSVPADPFGIDYYYDSDDTGSYYKIYAKLENMRDRCFTSTPNVCVSTGHSGTNCDGNPDSCNYVVTSPNVGAGTTSP